MNQSIPTIQLLLPKKRTPAVEHIAEVFRRQIQERCDSKRDEKFWNKINPGEYRSYQGGGNQVGEAAVVPVTVALGVLPSRSQAPASGKVAGNIQPAPEVRAHA